jgi:thiol-disulfide isomerase/thioredoxin
MLGASTGITPLTFPTMKIRSILAALTFGFLLLTPVAAQNAAPPSPIATEMNVIVNQVSEKMKRGRPRPTAESLAPELAAFDALLAKYPEKNEKTAEVAMKKAMLFYQVLGDEETTKKLLAAVVADFPGTKIAGKAERTLQSMTPEAKANAKADGEARRVKAAALIGAPAPELRIKWSSQADLKTLSSLNGQVVVLDFWATWCGPCIGSFPKFRADVAHFKGSPVTFLGVTTIQGSVSNMGARIDTKGDPAKEMALMPEFMKTHGMTWPVVIVEGDVFNPDYVVRGIPHVTIIAPDGTVRYNDLHVALKGFSIAERVEAILKEFKLQVPAAKS